MTRRNATCLAVILHKIKLIYYLSIPNFVNRDFSLFATIITHPRLAALASIITF